MPEPITMALGVAIGKLLLRWADLNDTADALEDTRAGFNALKSLRSKKATDPVNGAITDLLEQRLTRVRDEDRRHQMKIAVLNVAGVFTRLTDGDIVAAAQHPQGFPGYLTDGPGRTLLANTEEALTPFSRQVMNAGAAVFAELAPRSGRFTAGALLRLLDQVDLVAADVTGLHEVLLAARAELATSINRVAERVDALHPKVDRMLALTEWTRLGGDTVAASRLATEQGVVLGPPLNSWEPERLGVHDAITVHDETTLTPYVPRAHDGQLRALLKELDSPGAISRLVLIVGTSCTGKTRTLYEAVRQVLPQWCLIAPRTDTELGRILLDGVPAHTVVWLDELQDKLTKTSHGVTAANVMRLLLESAEVGPILFAGTVWPTNHDALLQRPTPEQSSNGVGAIPALLEAAIRVEVPETFTDDELAAAQNSEDARLRKAFATATEIGDPEQGRKITQVLAGGAQLINRLHPPPDNPPVDKFSPAARAVLHAAGDLRRVGMPNPLPRWAIEGAAPGYLQPATTRPAHTWLAAAIEEATHDATTDDQITGNRSLNVHAKGVPALTPQWTTDPAGKNIEAYDLHDYLYQDHLNRHRATPTRPPLWDTLTSHHHHLQDIKYIARSADEAPPESWRASLCGLGLEDAGGFVVDG